MNISEKTSEEIILKNILLAIKVLKKDAKRYTDKLVFSKVLSFSKTPREYDEISGILKR